MQKNKIAAIIWSDGIGGAERSLLDLAAAIDKDRFEMRIFYLSGGPDFFANQIQQHGLGIEFLRWKNGFDFRGRLRLITRLKQYNPNLVHNHNSSPLIPLMIKLRLNLPMIQTEHGTALIRENENRPFRRILEKIDLFCCDIIAANSSASSRALQKVYGISESKIRVIRLGINLDCFRRTKKKAKRNRCRIGYVGRIVNSHKGVDVLPALAKQLRNFMGDNFEVLVAGDGPDRIAVEQLCRELRVANYFQFLGWVHDVNSFLEDIDVLIIPSRCESLGLIAIEALAMDVPVVAFAVGGLVEILRECPVGTLVEPGDVEGMARAIVSLWNKKDNDWVGGQEFIKGHFSNYRMSSDLEKLYLGLTVGARNSQWLR